ncbi:MAG: thiamine pyrophosphate-dependent dehydrogenase E1 component subunit alpha, partial [Bacteroidota bacterium]
MIDQSDVIQQLSTEKEDNDTYVSEVLNDYWISCVSREASLLGRREVLTGKAKFGILGDGKEVPQVAMARAFKKGDWRSGYYRDMTFMFALGLSTIEDFFAQLYADAENDPFSGGRQMNSHYASVSVDEQGQWTNHLDIHNISSDISSTGGQMARALGLALASKKYREILSLEKGTTFSRNGNEVCFCTIGDASTSEGIFWETMNAAAVMQVPLVVSVWDDGYGISVPKKYQTVKQSISKALEGMRFTKTEEGLDIVRVDGRDYAALRNLYETKIEAVRQSHRPTLIHVEHLTQPQGHSTSGSHERYKSKDRLQWERENDCLLRMRQWILREDYASEEALEKIEAEAKEYVRAAKNRAWKAFADPVNKKRDDLLALYQHLIVATKEEEAKVLEQELKKMIDPTGAEILQNARRMLFILKGRGGNHWDQLVQFARDEKERGWEKYS